MSLFFCLHFKGSVAKKPYNPILGEMFRCFWVLPECEASRTEVGIKTRRAFLESPEDFSGPKSHL